MNRLAPYAWVAVLGTALALSWWSLDTLGRHYGMPVVLAGMVSATFDGGALVAGDLALRRAEKDRSAFGVKLLMLSAVGLSAWLNWEHGELLGYPVAARVLFAAPSVIAGWLFELQLGSMHADRARKHVSVFTMPRFGVLVWGFHPWAALRRMSQISGSRLRSIPVSVADWNEPQGVVAATPGWVVSEAGVPETEQAPMTARPSGPLVPGPGLLEPGARRAEVPEAASVGAADQTGEPRRGKAEAGGERGTPAAGPQRPGRKRVPDEVYVEKLRALVDEAGGTMPSIREAARLLGVGQDRARRVVGMVKLATTGE